MNDQQPKNSRAFKILTFVGMAIMASAFNVWMKKEFHQKKEIDYARVARQQTIVWVPGMNGMIAYADVEVLKQDANLIRFRTKDGQVLEQHGVFRVEIRNRY